MTKKNESWKYAIEKGGFYFCRAKYLGMKAPSHETVDAFNQDFDTLTSATQQLVKDVCFMIRAASPAPVPPQRARAHSIRHLQPTRRA